MEIRLSIIAFYFMFGAYGQINTVIDSLELELKAAKEDTSKVNNLNSLSYQYYIISNYALATKYSESALLLARELKYEKGKAKAYGNLGIVYDNQGNYPKALESYLSSLKIREEIGDKEGIAHSYNNIGTHYQYTGNYKEALENYLYSLNIWEEIGSKVGIAGSYNNIGTLYGIQGNYPEALKNFFACLKIREEIGDMNGDPGSYSNIGLVYSLQGNYTKALEYFLYSLNIWEEIGHKGSIASCYHNIGVVYYRQGNYSEARKYQNKGLALRLKIGNKSAIKESYDYLSKLDSVEGNYEQSLKHYKMSALYKDSLFNEKSNKQLSQLKIQFETQKKDQEIELLNKDNDIKELQFEQQLEKQRLVQHGMIAGTMILLLVGVLIFRSFRLHKKLDQQLAVSEERNRISADLHDDIGSDLSRIMLLSELLKGQDRTPKTIKEADKISTISQELISKMGEIIWALNSKNDFLETMIAYIRRYAAEYFETSDVKLFISIPEQINKIPISAERRRNIFYTVKEALHNIIKHARATEAELKFLISDNIMSVIISDNGKGISPDVLNRFGNGLKSMEKRMLSINGEFKIENLDGTRITLSIRL